MPMNNTKANEKLKAYILGQQAKAKALLRVSPFYENSEADVLFFRGYDGLTEEGESQNAKMEEIENVSTEGTN